MTRLNFRNIGPSPKSPTIASLEIIASKSSNVNLTCWIEYGHYCPDDLSWHLNDNGEPISENGPKFKVEEKDSRSKCKKEFILSIFNVTESDEGTYSCHWHCEYGNTTKAAIDLKVLNPQPTGRKLSIVKSNSFSRLFSLLSLNVDIMVKSVIPREDHG